ncbi:MAG: glycosyltransferase family 1 protein, partial [Thermodesulfobacteriota bacterium]|nr:glycosyltransferase family 1 protein [Thermodesulfobacteriota bacterium]
SNSDGTREAVRDGKLGLLVDPGDPKQLKEAIIKALNKQKVIPEGLEYFSFNNFSRRLHNIIDQLIGTES